MSSGYDMTAMVMMHDALRRDLNHIATITARAGDDPRRILAGAAGWEIFKMALHIHHSCEDDALWGPMLATLATRPDDLAVVRAMETEHSSIDSLIAAVDDALADPGSGPDRAAAVTGTLSDTLRGHLAHEEADGFAVIQAAATPEQVQHFAQLSATRPGPDIARLVPWSLEGADGKVVEMILGILPEPVRALYQNQWQPAFAAMDRWNGAA